MTLPFPTVWKIDLPTWVSMTPVIHGGALVARVGDRLHAVSAADGATVWSRQVDPGGGAGHLLHGYDDLQITDRRPDPLRNTELVAVRGGELAWTHDLGCIVEGGASAIAAGLLYVVGNSGNGIVLRAVELAGGKRVVDVPLPDGGDGVVPIGDRLLVLNRRASPGLSWRRPDGSADGTLEETPAHEVRVAGGRLLTALRDGAFPRRTLQVRDLASAGAEVAWTAPAHTAAIGIDGDCVGHLEAGEGEGVPVVRDAGSGTVRWRGAPIASDPARVVFAGGLVGFGHMTGLTLYRRDGAAAGEVASGRTVQAVGERVVLGGFKFLACCEPAR